ncbi:MAG: NfeD family protein [Pseudomonadales bacterium]
MPFFEQLVFWHWLVLALILLVLELFAPAAFFIWISAAAAFVGLLLFIVPVLSWQLQFVIFSVVAIASVFVGRRYLRKQSQTDGDSTLNRRGEQYVGRIFTLDEPIMNGTGRVRVDDSYWRVIGPDLAPGAKIKVNSVEGASFVVEAAG